MTEQWTENTRETLLRPQRRVRLATRFARGKDAVSCVSAVTRIEKSCGDRIRTCDLEVMSLASYRAAPPRVMVPSVTHGVAGFTDPLEDAS